MFDDVWTSFLSQWNSLDFRVRCIQAQKIWTSNAGGSLHTDGSINIHEHVICMEHMHETYMLHWISFVIDFELCLMITYSIIQCLNVLKNIWYLIILHWIISNLRSWMILSCITIILFMFVVYKKKIWFVLHILMSYLSRLIYKRVMVNLLMKDRDGHTWVTFFFVYFSYVIYIRH